jgi:hypothetical protein
MPNLILAGCKQFDRFQSRPSFAGEVYCPVRAKTFMAYAGAVDGTGGAIRHVTISLRCCLAVKRCQPAAALNRSVENVNAD